MLFSRKIFLSCALVSLAQLSYAQTGSMENGCKTKARSEAVVILVCPQDASSDMWRAAGEAACGQKLACNAWVWDDHAKAPGTAPVTDADLPKKASAQAVAVWVNDSKSLMTLKKTGLSK